MTGLLTLLSTHRQLVSNDLCGRLEAKANPSHEGVRRRKAAERTLTRRSAASITQAFMPSYRVLLPWSSPLAALITVQMSRRGHSL